MGAEPPFRRDDHVKAEAFLNVAKFPVITFKSTKVTPAGDGAAKVEGTLKIRHVEKPVTIDAEFLGSVKVPWCPDKSGVEKIGFSGKTKISRKEFGTTFNAAVETGGLVVGDTVSIELEIEATQGCAGEHGVPPSPSDAAPK